MDFLSRMTRLPHAFDPERGAEAQALLPALSGDLGRLLHGAAGCSPYLKSLIEKEQGWLPGALDDPEAAMQALFEELRAGAPDQRASALRMGKRRVAVLA